jgi:hypothetical protein
MTGYRRYADRCQPVMNDKYPIVSCLLAERMTCHCRRTLQKLSACSAAGNPPVAAKYVSPPAFSRCVHTQTALG